MEIAVALIGAVRVYAIVGFGVAVLFLFIGMDRIDDDAQGAYIFRPLLVPGIVVLWPIVLMRWISLERAKRGRAA